MEQFSIAVGQWAVDDDVSVNLRRAAAFLRTAADRGAQLCVLPEMFQTPYEMARIARSAEPASGRSITHVRELARELGLFVVAGSIAEESVDAGERKLYNTAFVIDDRGEILGHHRKIHLFDVDLASVKVKESSVLSPGRSPLVVELPFARLGVAVCYDARFPEVFAHFERRGVEVAAIPAAFSETTGAAHWHVLLRSRAIDYQIFLAAACPAPQAGAAYVAYGHSLVAGPWGNVLAEAGVGEETITAVLDPEELARVRRELPLRRHRRRDLYAKWSD